MDPLKSCNDIRESLLHSNLHYQINETPFSLFITVRKKFLNRVETGKNAAPNNLQVLEFVKKLLAAKLDEIKQENTEVKDQKEHLEIALDKKFRETEEIVRIKNSFQEEIICLQKTLRENQDQKETVLNMKGEIKELKGEIKINEKYIKRKENEVEELKVTCAKSSEDLEKTSEENETLRLRLVLQNIDDENNEANYTEVQKCVHNPQWKSRDPKILGDFPPTIKVSTEPDQSHSTSQLSCTNTSLNSSSSSLTSCSSTAQTSSSRTTKTISSHTPKTLDPSTRLDSTTSTSRNTTLDPNSTSTLDHFSSLHTTNSVDPKDLQATYLGKTSSQETGKTVKDENFFHNIHEKKLETETENPEEDFSHLSLEEQAVLRQISLMIRQTL
jgi:hypothetical protein